MRSLRAQLLLVTLGSLLLGVGAVGWLATGAVRDAAMQEAVHGVSLSAAAREQALLLLLRRQNDRLASFLRVARLGCDESGRRGECRRKALEDFLSTEGALAGRLAAESAPGGSATESPSILLGQDAASLPADPGTAGQLARFEPGTPGRRTYLLAVREGGLMLTVRFPLDPINALFKQRFGLGASGEIFLVDSQGYFVTEPRYPSDSGRSHPIDVAPMVACLRGEHGQQQGRDYRDVPVVHGYRTIEELGGGCVMAHIDSAEVFAPIRAMTRKIVLGTIFFAAFAGGLAFWLGRRVSRPLVRLTERARDLARGDFQGLVPVAGPEEVRTFAEAFTAMIQSLERSTAAVRESEAQLRALFDNALDAVVGMDESGRITEWNRRAETIFGWTRTEAVGRKLRDLIIPERYRDAHDRGLRRYLETGQGPILNRRVEIAGLHRNGTERPVELAVTSVKRHGRQLFFSLISDITERKRAEEGLQRQSAVTRAITENATLGLFMLDAQQRCTYMNSAAEAITGFSLSELRERALHDVIHHSRPDGRFYPVGECPIDRALPTKNRETGEEAFVRKDGTFYDVAFTASPILDGGEPVGTIIEVEDISVRKRIEHQREQAAAEQELLAAASELLLSSLDYRKTLAAVAEIVVPKLADACVVDLAASTDADSDAPPNREELAVACGPALTLERIRWLREKLSSAPGHGVATVLETGRPEILDADDSGVVPSVVGERRGALSVMIVPLGARGRTLGAITFIADATARSFARSDLGVAMELAHRAALAVDNALLLRQAEQAIRLRDEFLSIASHELRTPLTPLTLQVQRLEQAIRVGKPDMMTPERMGETVQKMRKQVERLTALIENLLDVSRIQTGRIELNLEPVDLVDLVREVGARFAEDFARARSELRIEAEGSVVGWWDRLRIEQVLVNLVTNALKYGPGKPILVSVSAVPGGACLKVADQGIGIPAEEMARIFGLFERAVSARAYGGLGLGLYIVKQIVEAHRGEVTVESIAGQGATFTVRLPLGEAEAEKEGLRHGEGLSRDAAH